MAYPPCFGDPVEWAGHSPDGSGEYTKAAKWLVLSGKQEEKGLFDLLPILADTFTAELKQHEVGTAGWVLW